MYEKNGKRVVAGIATRRISGKRERKILLVRKKNTWGIPETEVRPSIGDQENLRNYLSEEVFGRRVGINQLYKIFRYSNGSGREVETYFVTAYGGRAEERNHVRWFDRCEINPKGEYSISNETSKIIKHLIEEGHF